MRICLMRPASKDKMKVLLWTTVPSHYMRHFVSALRYTGVDITVCYYSRMNEERKALGWNDPQELPGGEHFVEQKTGAALESVGDWRERIHIVPGCGELFLRQLAVKLSMSGVPWVHWSEPSHPGLRRWLSMPRKRWYGGMINRYALGALGIGVKAIEDIRLWGVKPQRISFMPYSCNGGNRRVRPDAQCDEFVNGARAFIFIGRLCRRKAVDMLLYAFAAAAKKAPEWKLLLVGNDGAGGAYQQLARRLGIEERVLFRGAVPADEIFCAINAADVLVLPSRFDGWGVVINEAASMGLGIVASDAAGASYHLVDHGVNGFRFRSGNQENLTRAMSAYCASPELADLHGMNSIRIFENTTPEVNARRFVEIIRSWEAMPTG